VADIVVAVEVDSCSLDSVGIVDIPFVVVVVEVVLVVVVVVFVDFL
jgi:hypothetical protein